MERPAVFQTAKLIDSGCEQPAPGSLKVNVTRGDLPPFNIFIFASVSRRLATGVQTSNNVHPPNALPRSRTCTTQWLHRRGRAQLCPHGLPLSGCPSLRALRRLDAPAARHQEVFLTRISTLAARSPLPTRVLAETNEPRNGVRGAQLSDPTKAGATACSHQPIEPTKCKLMRNEETCALVGCPLLRGGDCHFCRRGMAVFQSSGRLFELRLKRLKFAISEMCFVLRTLICRSTN